MKSIYLSFEQEEFDNLMKRKGDLSWKEFVLNIEHTEAVPVPELKTQVKCCICGTEEKMLLRRSERLGVTYCKNCFLLGHLDAAIKEAVNRG